MTLSVRRRLLGFVFGVAALLVVAAVWRWRGVSQVGNALSFCGGLMSLWPTVKALRLSLTYSRAIKTPGPPELQAAEKAAEQARRRRLLAFDATQFAQVVVGVALMSVGFAWSIVFAPAPPR